VIYFILGIAAGAAASFLPAKLLAAKAEKRRS
jgi:hypothetical protein